MTNYFDINNRFQSSEMTSTELLQGGMTGNQQYRNSLSNQHRFDAEGIKEAVKEVRDRQTSPEFRQKMYKGIGAPVDSSMSIDEQVKAAGLDWEVKKSYVRYGEFFEEVDEATCAVYRPADPDRGMPKAKRFCYASPEWTPFQNTEIVETFNKFCNDAGIEIEHLGALQDGGCIFATARMNETFSVMNSDDIVAGRILLTNYHTYGKGLRVDMMTVRLICTNGLTTSVRNKSKVITHLGAYNPDKVMDTLIAAQTNFNAMHEDMEHLADKEVTDRNEVLLHLCSALMTPSQINALKAQHGDNLTLEHLPQMVQNAYQMYFNGTSTGAQLQSKVHSAYNLLQCVTQIVNHESVVRNGVETHMNSLWLGDKQGTKRKMQESLYNSLALAYVPRHQLEKERAGQSQYASIRAF